MYLLDSNILAHPRQYHFYVSTRQYYSCAFLDTSISTHLLDSNILAHPRQLHSTYLLEQNILAHPRDHYFYVSTRPKYLFRSISTYYIHTIQIPKFHNIHTGAYGYYSILQITPIQIHQLRHLGSTKAVPF